MDVNGHSGTIKVRKLRKSNIIGVGSLRGLPLRWGGLGGRAKPSPPENAGGSGGV